MPQSSLPLGEMIVSALGGGTVTKLADWLLARGKTLTDIEGKVDRAVGVALEGVTKEVERAHDRVERVEAQHQECEKNLREVNSRLDESERERRQLKAKIDELMSGPIPGYTLGPKG